MDFDDFQWMELCETLGLHGDVRTFEVVEAVKTLIDERDEHERESNRLAKLENTLRDDIINLNSDIIDRDHIISELKDKFSSTKAVTT